MNVDAVDLVGYKNKHRTDRHEIRPYVDKTVCIKLSFAVFLNHSIR